MNENERERLREFQDMFHPRHFYCRLRDIDLDKKSALIMAEIYEIGIYNKIMDLINEE